MPAEVMVKRRKARVSNSCEDVLVQEAVKGELPNIRRGLPPSSPRIRRPYQLAAKSAQGVSMEAEANHSPATVEAEDRDPRQVRSDALKDLGGKAFEKIPIAGQVKLAYDVANDLEKIRSGEDKELVDKVQDRLHAALFGYYRLAS